MNWKQNIAIKRNSRGKQTKMFDNQQQVKLNNYNCSMDFD